MPSFGRLTSICDTSATPMQFSKSALNIKVGCSLLICQTNAKASSVAHRSLDAAFSSQRECDAPSDLVEIA